MRQPVRQRDHTGCVGVDDDSQILTLATTPRGFGRLLMLLVALSGPSAAGEKPAAPSPPAPIVVTDVTRHVEWLADPARRGRSGEAARQSAEYLRDHFQRLKLKPLFGDSYFQPLPGRKDKSGRPLTAGRNVGAVLPGQKPDEIVILSAHYDHEGTTDSGIFNGACLLYTSPSPRD